MDCLKVVGVDRDDNCYGFPGLESLCHWVDDGETWEMENGYH